jgi:hypothetical protein
MVTVAQGRDEVLAYLEDESEKTAGKPGVYMLLKDDSGTLIAIIAGRSFYRNGLLFTRWQPHARGGRPDRSSPEAGERVKEH